MMSSGLADALLASESDAIVATGSDGVITFWNPGAVRIFGFAEQEAIGQSLDLIIRKTSARDIGRVTGGS